MAFPSRQAAIRWAQNLDAGIEAKRGTIPIVLEGGAMRLDPEKEQRLVRHMRSAELYASAPAADGMTFRPPIDYPPHERRVEIAVDLGMGGAECDVLGADLTHEYVTENADYRS